MPLYNPSPLASAPVLLQPGLAEYLLGRRTTSQSDTRFYVTAVNDDGTTASYTGQILEGNAPVVGSLLTAQTNNATYNVVNAPVTATNLNANGAGTISVASVAAGSPSVGGYAVVPVPEIPETIQNGFSLPAMLPLMGGSSITRKLMAEIVFSTLPTAATVYLQSAMRNVPNEYVNLQLVGSVAGGAASVTQSYFDGEGMFYRFAVSGVTGSGSILAKLVVGQ